MEKPARSKSLMLCCSDNGKEDKKQVSFLLGQKGKPLQENLKGQIIDVIKIARPAGAAYYRTQIRTSFKPATNFNYLSPPIPIQSKIISPSPQIDAKVTKPFDTFGNPFSIDKQQDLRLRLNKNRKSSQSQLSKQSSRNTPHPRRKKDFIIQQPFSTGITKPRPSSQSSRDSRYNIPGNLEQKRQEIVRQLMQKYKKSQISLHEMIKKSHECSTSLAKTKDSEYTINERFPNQKLQSAKKIQSAGERLEALRLQNIQQQKEYLINQLDKKDNQLKQANDTVTILSLRINFMITQKFINLITSVVDGVEYRNYNDAFDALIQRANQNSKDEYLFD